MLKFRELDDKKKKMIILITTLILFIGVSFAFIAAQLSGGAIGNANVTADTTDNLQFSVNKDIYLNPTQFNVVEGGSGLSDTAVGTASLIANSTTNEVSATYNVYFLIDSNEYIYTTEDYKPEIVLTITDPNGEKITEVQGLEYVTVQNADGSEVSGFDITTAGGLHNIVSNYGITSASSINATEQDWTFTVTFVNLTTNQTENSGSTLDAEIILSREETNYHEVCEEGTFACNVARLYNEENPESNGIYYHNGSTIGETEYCIYDGNKVLSFTTNSASTNSEDCATVYSIGGRFYDSTIISNGIEEGAVEEVAWNATNSACETINGNQVYNDDNTTTSQEQCIGYALVLDENISFIMNNVGSGTIESPILDAEDNSYRYSGANPNNYVCFGSTGETCPYENLYRIIGVFDGQVKLIKADYTTSEMLGTDGRDYYGSYVNLNHVDSSYYNKGNMDINTVAAYSWNNDTSVSTLGSNNWTTSEFNTINLNTNYWNYLGETWQNLISTTTWSLGGMLIMVNNTAKDFYEIERNNAGYGSNPTKYKDEIGLMYASDYGYAAAPSSWIVDLIDDYGYANISNNWMYMGLYEWTITPFSLYNFYTLFVYRAGTLPVNPVSLGLAVRPVFYLKSNIELAGGTGSSTDPYRLAD